MPENYEQLLQEKLDDTIYQKLAALANNRLLRFVADAIELCEPDTVWVADDSAEDSGDTVIGIRVISDPENPRLRPARVKQTTPGCRARYHQQRADRPRTKATTRDRILAGPTETAGRPRLRRHAESAEPCCLFEYRR